MKGILTYLRERFAFTARPAKSALPPKSSGNRVLVVDDDNGFCRIIQRTLSREHYQVQTSQSVADALGTIEQKPFDAYVIDYKLLDGSGLDVADSIRSKRNEAPIVFMSGYDTSSVASRAEKFHAFFLQKPFSRETICYAVKKAIGSPKAHWPDSNPEVECHSIH
jgi:two-component system response regulator RegA